MEKQKNEENMASNMKIECFLVVKGKQLRILIGINANHTKCLSNTNLVNYVNIRLMNLRKATAETSIMV